MRLAETMFCQGVLLNTIHDLVSLTLAACERTKCEIKRLSAAAAVAFWRDMHSGWSNDKFYRKLYFTAFPFAMMMGRAKTEQLIFTLKNYGPH